MRNFWTVAVLLCALPLGSMADKPKVTRTMIRAMEESMDQKIQALWPDSPAQMVGLTQGAYINGYGAVFMTEVNLAVGPVVSPFHLTVTPEEVKRLHDRKVMRLGRLKDSMQQMLHDSAGSMDAVAGDEQIALGVSFFYFYWENKDGLPAQIVMHAPKKALLDASGKFSILSDEF